MLLGPARGSSHYPITEHGKETVHRQIPARSARVRAKVLLKYNLLSHRALELGMTRISRRTFSVALVLGLAFGLSACKGDSGGSDEAAPKPADTATAAAPAAVAPTPTAVAPSAVVPATAIPNEPASTPQANPAPEDVTENASTASGTGSIAYTTSEHKQEPRGQVASPLALSALSHMGNLTVNIKSFSYYCEPTPSFTASKNGRTLVLTLNKATAVARCMGLHDMKLTFAALDMKAGFDTVNIVSEDGKELGSAGVARAR